MNWNDIHLIKKDGLMIAFHHPTSSIKTINGITYNIISLLQKGLSIPEIITMFPSCNNTIEGFVKSMEEYYMGKNHMEKTGKTSFPIERQINRITLHVSNDCNLRCKYCYAQGGNYGQLRNMMSKKTADDFVSFCVKEFRQVNNIVFFGGEPFLNLDVMNYICERFRMENRKGFLMPKFSVITNGTILNDDVLDFIKANIYSITVSIDGPRQINDENRVLYNGKGSYESISHFIRTVKAETTVRMTYEATYTNSHEKHNITHKDIIDYLSSEFGIAGVVENEAENMFSYDWIKADKDCIKEKDFEHLSTNFWRNLYTLVNNAPNGFCPVIEKIFAVNTEGIIYACHMLNGHSNDELGNIGSTNVFNDKSSYDEYLKNIHFENNEKCKSCWSQKFCGGCIRRFYDKEKQMFSQIPNEEICRRTCEDAENFIVLITLIRKNPKLWSNLIEYRFDHIN